jgi:hypothetical protein
MCVLKVAGTLWWLWQFVIVFEHHAVSYNTQNGLDRVLWAPRVQARDVAEIHLKKYTIIIVTSHPCHHYH